MSDPTQDERVEAIAYSEFTLGEDETGGPAFFWHNPWSEKDERVASLWWPEHPSEATAEIEALFANLELRDKRIKDIVSDAADAYDAGYHAGCQSATARLAELEALVGECERVFAWMDGEGGHGAAEHDAMRSLLTRLRAQGGADG